VLYCYVPGFVWTSTEQLQWQIENAAARRKMWSEKQRNGSEGVPGIQDLSVTKEK
jgi:hypothetical protein